MGDLLLVDVLPQPGVGRDQATGALVGLVEAELLVEGVLVLVVVVRVVLGVGVDVGLLLGEPLVQGLALQALGLRRVVVVALGRPVGRRVAPVEHVREVAVVQRVTRLELVLVVDRHVEVGLAVLSHD